MRRAVGLVSASLCRRCFFAFKLLKRLIKPGKNEIMFNKLDLLKVVKIVLFKMSYLKHVLDRILSSSDDFVIYL